MVGVGACSNTNPTDEFCTLIENQAEVGPLFPHRLDGEPVPNYEALKWLHDLAEYAPSEIAAQLNILADEADALVAQAEARHNPLLTPPSNEDSPPETLTKEAIDAAQRDAIHYIKETCQVEVG